VYPYSVAPSDIWNYPTRTLTRPPQYIQVGKAFLRVLGVVDSGIFTAPAPGDYDLLVVPPGEVWMLYYIGGSDSFFLHDGVNKGDIPFASLGAIGKFTSFLPLKGNWKIIYSPSVAGRQARALAFKLDPSQVSVIGGVKLISANTEITAFEPGSYYRVFMHGTTKGDGTNSGRIIVFHGAFATTTDDLASGTGNVTWTGIKDDFTKIDILNEAESAVLADIVGIEVYF